MKVFAVVICLAIFALGVVGNYMVDQYRLDKISKLSPPYPALYSERRISANLVLFGDSRAEGWRTGLFGHGIEVLNSGLGGDVTSSMVSRLESDVLAADPTVVVLLAGINDLVAISMMKDRDKRENQLNQTFNNIKWIVKRLTKKNIQVIIFSISPPLDPDFIRRLVWGTSIDKTVNKLNGKIKELQEPSVTFIDLESIFSSLGEEWIDLVRLDTLHYTHLVYEVLTRKVISLLEQGE